MQSYPRYYSVQAYAPVTGSVAVSAEGLPALQTAPPAQFGGPGDQWSPETLFVGAAANCFVLTFRAIARASSLSWIDLRCSAVGTLNQIDGKTRFTHLELRARLAVPAGTDTAKVARALEKAEHTCLITNSLALAPTFLYEIRSAENTDVAA